MNFIKLNKKDLALSDEYTFLMTFKDLEKKISLETKQQSRLFERLLNKPFWISDKQQQSKKIS